MSKLTRLLDYVAPALPYFRYALTLALIWYVMHAALHNDLVTVAYGLILLFGVRD